MLNNEIVDRWLWLGHFYKLVLYKLVRRRDRLRNLSIGLDEVLHRVLNNAVVGGGGKRAHGQHDADEEKGSWYLHNHQAKIFRRAKGWREGIPLGTWLMIVGGVGPFH